MAMFKKIRKFAKYEPRKFFLVLSVLLVLLLGASVLYFTGRVPRSLIYPLWLACVSVVTFVFYGYDKRQSQRTGSGDKNKTGHDKDEPFAARVPELVLHVLSLVGGFTGAYFGRKIFRHKTQKKFFTFVIVLSFVLHIALAVQLYLL